MNKRFVRVFLAAAVVAISGLATAHQTVPNKAGMQHEIRTSEARGVGVVKAIDSVTGRITLQHEAIASIGWPAMTMAFKVVSPGLLKDVKIGDDVQFTLQPDGMDSMLTSITTVQTKK